eukprot:jgi/Chrzof1/3963/Cz13g15070.t1
MLNLFIICRMSYEICNNATAVGYGKLLTGMYVPCCWLYSDVPAAGSGPSEAPQAAANTQTYKWEQLRLKTNKDLADILKAKGLRSTGKKEELIQRILEFQRRQKSAGQPS